MLAGTFLLFLIGCPHVQSTIAGPEPHPTEGRVDVDEKRRDFVRLFIPVSTAELAGASGRASASWGRICEDDEPCVPGVRILFFPADAQPFLHPYTILATAVGQPFGHIQVTVAHDLSRYGHGANAGQAAPMEVQVPFSAFLIRGSRPRACEDPAALTLLEMVIGRDISHGFALFVHVRTPGGELELPSIEVPSIDYVCLREKPE